MNNRDLIEAVRSTILRRQTCKVLAQVDDPVQYTEDELSKHATIVRECIGSAGWAPFHYDRGQDGIAEPWRFYVLDNASCRGLARCFHALFPDVKPGNKLPSLLAGCSQTVLVTWIPQAESQDEKLAQVNSEHLAATAAAVQNLLLLLHVHGAMSYWSSGGQLGSAGFFRRVGIDTAEKLMAAVFVHFPPRKQPAGLEIVGGKNRRQRDEAQRWCKQVRFSG